MIQEVICNTNFLQVPLHLEQVRYKINKRKDLTCFQNSPKDIS